jgi:hypothetical protein
LEVLVTAAVNCSVPDDETEVAAGLTVTVIDPRAFRVKDFVAVLLGEEESTTWAVKVNCPVCEVVPESKPLLAKVMPVGRVPDAMLQWYGVVPPVADRVAEYTVPAVALAREVVVTESADTEGVTVTAALPNFVESTELVAVTVASVLALTEGA